MEANGHSQSHALLVLHHQLASTHQSAAMAFSGVWKVDRNENYDKFMEAMGESIRVCNFG